MKTDYGIILKSAVGRWSTGWTSSLATVFTASISSRYETQSRGRVAPFRYSVRASLRSDRHSATGIGLLAFRRELRQKT